MDAEEERQGLVGEPGTGEPGGAEPREEPLVLSPRPLPDVVFGAPKAPPGAPEPSSAPPSGPAADPGEVTGPQPVVGASEVPPPAGGGIWRLGVPAAVAVAGVAAVAAVAVALWPSGSDGRMRQTAPATGPSTPGDGAEGPAAGPGGPSRRADSAAPGSGPVEAADVPSVASGEPAPSWPVFSGRTPRGISVTYQTVEVAQGYFEGELRLVNETGAALPDWTLSFAYPGASIRNVWGGESRTEADGRVVVTGTADTAPVAAGAWVSVRFGGSGAPSRPEGCTVNGEACGF